MSKTAQKTNYYINGNTVRRLEGDQAERQRQEQERQQRKKRKERRRVARRNAERATRIDLSYVLFCTVALAAVCSVCITYIRLQSNITSRTRHISELESEIATLRAENDAAQKRIELTTDLDQIKEQALQYGMKYAAEDQIVYYTIEENDYMDQYFNIPTN
ncbi:MAG: hypothetical protein HFJ04_10155 [Lachnospiraceae bacterium]|nr:hypothetical protein [Lachnospiraceae bacterium]